MAQNNKNKVFSEVVAFLDLLDESFINKLPPKLLEFFENNADPDYTPTYDLTTPINKQNLCRKAIVIISKLNLQYWASEEEKKSLIDLYNQNNKKNN